MNCYAKRKADKAILRDWKLGYGIPFDCMEDARCAAHRCGLPEKFVTQVREQTPCGMEFLTNLYVYMLFLKPEDECSCGKTHDICDVTQ